MKKFLRSVIYRLRTILTAQLNAKLDKLLILSAHNLSLRNASYAQKLGATPIGGGGRHRV